MKLFPNLVILMAVLATSFFPFTMAAQEAGQEFTSTNGYPNGYNDPSTDYPYPEVFGKTYMRIQVAGTENIPDYPGPFIAPGTKIEYLSSTVSAPDSKFGPPGSNYTIPADFDSQYFYLFGAGENHKQSSDIVDTGHFETIPAGEYTFKVTNSSGTEKIVTFIQESTLTATDFSYTAIRHTKTQGAEIKPVGSIVSYDEAGVETSSPPTYFRILESTASEYSGEVIREGETLLLPESGTYTLSMSGINSKEHDYSAKTLTIVYDGNLELDQDKTVAYIYREGNRSFLQVKMLHGNPPYIYFLDTSGQINESGLFYDYSIVPDLGITVIDAFLQSFSSTIPVLNLATTPIAYPEVIEVDEGETIQLNALYLGEEATYTWSGPGNFSSTEQSPQIMNVTAAMEGTYMVTCNLPRGGTPISDMIRVVVITSPPVQITGDQSLCQHTSTQLTGTPANGRWESLDETVATVSSSGVVTGISAGKAEIRYSAMTIEALESSVSMDLTVYPLPVAGFEVSNTIYGENTLFTSLSSGDIMHYYWDLGDGTTANSSYIIHQYSTPGTYWVELEVTNRAGCTDRFTRYIEITEETPTGNEDIRSQNTNLRVYPNPVRQEQLLTIETGLTADQCREAQLHISDLSGRLIRTQPITGEQMTVRMPSGPGVYLILIDGSGSAKSVKVVVK